MYDNQKHDYMALLGRFKKILAAENGKSEK